MVSLSQNTERLLEHDGMAGRYCQDSDTSGNTTSKTAIFSPIRRYLRFTTFALIAGYMMTYKCGTWSEEEVSYLRLNYLEQSNAEMAHYLGRDVISIDNKMHKLKLIRPDALRRKISSVTWFRKGQVPHNKGKKCPNRPGMMATQFKHSNIPPQTKHDGCISIRTENNGHGGRRKIKYIRVALAQWRYLHHVIWEKEHGPIPENHVLRFKNGNTLDVRLENLELISRADNARKNTNRKKARLSDGNILNNLAWSNPELKEHIKKHAPELIDLKRQALILTSKIQEAA